MMSRPPNLLIASLTICSGKARSVTSPTTLTASPPAAVMVSMASCAGVGSMSLRTTLAPCRANSSAAARPMPRPAPVMMATFPSSSFSTFKSPPLSLKADSAAVASSALFFKNCFWNHGMNAFVAVNQLRDVDVGGDAGQHIGVVTREALLRDQKIDHLAYSPLGRFGQIFVQAHGDEMRRRFCARPAQVHVFADDQLKSADQRRFKRRNVNLPIALTGVAVARQKQRAGRMHRDIQGRA